MNENKTLKITFMTKVTLLIAAFWTMADMFVVTPLLQTIATAYPDASGLAVNLCYCLSQGTIILGSLFVAHMSSRIVKKHMMILGGILVAIFGGFNGLMPGIPMMLVFRALEGFGAGMCITLIPTMISDLYHDENERNKLMGFQAAVGCVFGSALAALSGYIADAVGYEKSYFLFFISIIVTILVIAFVPATPKDKPEIVGEKVKLNAASWGVFVLAIIFGLLSSALLTYVSYVIEGNGLGTASQSGLATSIIQIGSFVGGLIMAAMYSKIKGYLEPVSWLASAIGGIMLMIAALVTKSVILAYIGCLMCGFTNGILFPWLYAKSAIVCAPNTEGKTIAYVNVGYYIGMFAAVFFYEAILTATKASANLTIYILIVGAAIYAIYGLITNLKRHGELVDGQKK